MNDYEFIDFDDSLRVINHIEDVYKPLNGHTFTSDGELAVLYELARNACLPKTEDGCIFECGTWFGISAIAMAQGLKESRLSNYTVYTVDAYPPLRGQVESRQGLTVADAYPVHRAKRKEDTGGRGKV